MSLIVALLLFVAYGMSAFFLGMRVKQRAFHSQRSCDQCSWYRLYQSAKMPTEHERHAHGQLIRLAKDNPDVAQFIERLELN